MSRDQAKALLVGGHAARLDWFRQTGIPYGQSIEFYLQRRLGVQMRRTR